MFLRDLGDTGRILCVFIALCHVREELLKTTRVIDVSSEWRTFGNNDKKKSNHDPSRVGFAEDALLDGGDLSTTVSDIGVELPWARWQHRNNVCFQLVSCHISLTLNR